MPRVKFLLNIGAPDAKRLSLTKTLAGETADVSQDAADEMVRRGWATDRFDESRPSRSAAPINSAGQQSTPPADVTGDEGEEAPDLTAMTKDELLTHAKANGIPGVAPAMAKDDIRRTIERASGR